RAGAAGARDLPAHGERPLVRRCGAGDRAMGPNPEAGETSRSQAESEGGRRLARRASLALRSSPGTSCRYGSGLDDDGVVLLGQVRLALELDRVAGAYGLRLEVEAVPLVRRDDVRYPAAHLDSELLEQ